MPDVVLADHNGVEIGQKLPNLVLGQWRQSRGIGRLCLDEGLSNHIHGLLGRFDRDKALRLPFPEIELLGDQRQQLSQPPRIIVHGRMQRTGELLGLGRGIQRITQQVIIQLSRQLPVNSEPVCGPAVELSFARA